MQLSPIPPQQRAPIVISEDRPAYRITSQAGFFGPDDTLYPEGAMIYWDKEPSVEMEPLNSKARTNYKKLTEKLNKLGAQAAAKLGKGYSGYQSAHENAIELERLNEKQVQVIGSAREKKPLGNTRQGLGSVQQITAGSETPMTGADSMRSQANNIVDNKGKVEGGEEEVD